MKGNRPGLFARCKDLPWAKIRPASTVEVRHGRRVRRTIKVATALLDFADAVQVAQIRRTRTIAGKKTVEVVYVITSMPSHEASPLQIAAWVQGHWSIENRLHSGSATSPTTKTAHACEPGTRPGSWPACARPRSASHARPRPPTSPKPPDTTPATPPGPPCSCSATRSEQRRHARPSRTNSSCCSPPLDLAIDSKYSCYR